MAGVSVAGHLIEAASAMPAAQLSAMGAELKEKYGDNVPSALQDAIVEAVKSLKIAIKEATLPPDSGSRNSSTQNINGTGLLLPAELRNRIYELCIESPDSEVDIHWRYPFSFSPLTQVNRQLRRETLSYYHHCPVIKFCACIWRSGKMSQFLDGPGRTLIPYAKYFELSADNSVAKINLPLSNESEHELGLHVSGHMACDRMNTGLGGIGRNQIVDDLVTKAGLFLMQILEKREGAEYSIPMYVFREMANEFRRWNDEVFGIESTWKVGS